MIITIFTLFSLVAIGILLFPILKSYTNKEDISQKHKILILTVILILPTSALFLFYQFDNRLTNQPNSTTQQPANINHAGSLDTMIDSLKAKLQTNPDDIKGWNLLARSYLYIKDYKNALAAMKKSYELTPDDNGLKSEIQRISKLAGMAATARQPIQSIMQGPNGQQINVGAMVERLRKKLESNPDDFDGWMMLGRSYNNLGRLKDAINAYKKALVLKPNNNQANVLLNSLINRDQQTPRSNKVQNENLVKARAFMQKKQYTQAIEILQDKLSKTPNDIDTIIMLADATSMANGGVVNDTAYKLVKNALKINPKHPTALWLAGMAEYNKQDYVAALGYWTPLDKILAKGSADSDELMTLIKQAKKNLKGE